LEETDKTVNEICALQYIQRSIIPCEGCPYGTVAYFNAKYMGRIGGPRSKPVEILFDYKLTVEWVKCCFKREYVRLIMEEAHQWHKVVVGSIREHGDLAPKWLQTTIPVAYPQGDEDKCLFHCLASALHYMGLTGEAALLATFATESENLPTTRAIEALKAAMIECAPSIGRPHVFNSSKKKRRNNLTLKDVTSIQTEYPTVIIPLGTDGSVNHAICVVDDLIFDSTQRCAIKCKVESISWICDCGDKGVAGIREALRFKNPMGCKPLKREKKQNWTG
jgi:hypothetical protein